MFLGPWVHRGPNNGRRLELTKVAHCGRSGGQELVARVLGGGGADNGSCGDVGGARGGWSWPRDEEERSVML
jgi:hypothetical protein